MSSREIPREQWGRFLDEYSRAHAGWLVGVEVYDPTGGEERPSQRSSMRLERISPDRVMSGDFAITVKLGGEAGEHVLESVYNPVRIQIESVSDGLPPAIRIDSADGMHTRVRPLALAKGDFVSSLASP